MVSNKKNKKKERNGSKKNVLYYSKVIIGKYTQQKTAGISICSHQGSIEDKKCLATKIKNS